MLKPLAAVLLLVLSAPTPGHPPWGVVRSRTGTTPVLLASSHLPAGMRLTAFRVGEWRTRVGVTVGKGALKHDSELFTADGGNDSWEHEIVLEGALPGSALWLCLPAGVDVVGGRGREATIERAGKQVGTLKASPSAEGYDFAVVLDGVSDKGYLVLGYDLEVQ
jgi:hypothetical protein